MKKFVIVGSGRQGIAVAYDLLRDLEHQVTMVDVNPSFLESHSFIKYEYFSSFSKISLRNSGLLSIESTIKCESFLSFSKIKDSTDSNSLGSNLMWHIFNITSFSIFVEGYKI